MKIEALIRSIRFLSSEVALYLYKSTMQPCMECCHVWVGAPNYYLDMLDKLQQWVSKTVGPSASLQSLSHCRTVANLSLYYRNNFNRCSSKRLNWFHHLILVKVKGPLAIVILCMIFLRPFLDLIINSFSSIWNSLPPECFPLI